MNYHKVYDLKSAGALEIEFVAPIQDQTCVQKFVHLFVHLFNTDSLYIGNKKMYCPSWNNTLQLDIHHHIYL